MSILLDVKAIDVSYGSSQVLHGVTLSVERGTIVCLLGNNGAGKTTTMAAITGMVPLGSGSIQFDGEQIDGLSPPDVVARGIALSPEGRRVFPHMSAYENLLVGAHLIDPQRTVRNIDRVFELFPRLKERTKQKAGSLSGGEQQMLAIGRALMAEPRLLLLDEPSLGVAPIIVEDIVRTIRDLVDSEGISCIVVEQNAAMAVPLSERGYVMEHGAIVYEGSRDDLMSNDALKEAYLAGV